MTLIGFYEQGQSDSSWESCNSALIPPKFRSKAPWE